jgi:uncharacterized protein YbjT (DUF2867 family)
MYLVTGATGNVGAEVVQVLLRAGEPVRALVRDGDRPLPAGVEAAIGDMNDAASLRDALSGVSGAFLMAGYPALLEEVARGGLERVVLLSGSSADAANLDNPVSRYMVESEAAVRQSGASWTVLRPCAFMSNALQWAGQLREGDVVRLQFPDASRAVIDPRDIAAVATTALLDGDRHAGQTYRLSGPESLLPADQLRILGEAIGRDLRPQPLSNEQTRAELEQSMPVEYVDAFFSFYVDGGLDESTVLPTVEAVTGTPPRTFERWAADHAGDFALTSAQSSGRT